MIDQQSNSSAFGTVVSEKKEVVANQERMHLLLRYLFHYYSYRVCSQHEVFSLLMGVLHAPSHTCKVTFFEGPVLSQRKP